MASFATTPLGAGRAIGQVVNDYVAVHNAIFDSPWWRSLPIPFVFRPIKYNNHARSLGELRAVVSDIIENPPTRQTSWRRSFSMHLLPTLKHLTAHWLPSEPYVQSWQAKQRANPTQ